MFKKVQRHTLAHFNSHTSSNMPYLLFRHRSEAANLHHQQQDSQHCLMPMDVPLPPGAKVAIAKWVQLSLLIFTLISTKPMYVKDRWKHAGPLEGGHGAGGRSSLKGDPNQLPKQSSFESTDSSNHSASHVIIPMEEDARGQHVAGSTPARFFHFRKAPLQVFSKENERHNAPVI